MNGIKKRKSNLSLSTKSKNYSGSDKNTMKSRIHSMDKGWIGKKKEIKGMNRIKGNVMEGF